MKNLRPVLKTVKYYGIYWNQSHKEKPTVEQITKQLSTTCKKKKSEKQDSIFSLFMKSIHTVVNVLKELNDFDGVLAHILACLHPVELLQATLDLPQL